MGGMVQGMSREEWYRECQGRNGTGNVKGGMVQGMSREEWYRECQGRRRDVVMDVGSDQEMD
jgi:uncharacterized short protein YbdD (DUF466 family)